MSLLRTDFRATIRTFALCALPLVPAGCRVERPDGYRSLWMDANTYDAPMGFAERVRSSDYRIEPPLSVVPAVRVETFPTVSDDENPLPAAASELQPMTFQQTTSVGRATPIGNAPRGAWLFSR